MNDLKFALRQLLKNPGFTAVAVLTLTVCIGANLTIFAVVDAILLRPLPFPEADRLVTIFNTYPKAGVERDGSSLANYYERRGNISAFSHLSIFRQGTAIVGEPGATEQEDVIRVSPEFFATLGVVPVMGRAFTEEETTHQTDGAAILTDAFWRQHFNSDPAVLGRTLRVDGLSRTIVGVLPPDFRFLSHKARLYFPLSSKLEERGVIERHSGSGSDLIARLKPGATLAEAQSLIDAHNAALSATFPQAQMIADAGFRSVVVPLHSDHVKSIRPVLWLLQAAVLVLLLIGGVNLVNLLLIRASSRNKELAIRQSLGASTQRVVRQVMIETTLLAFIGGVSGLAAAAGGIQVLSALGVSQVPLGATITFDARLALVALLGSVAVGIASGIPIAWFNLGTYPAQALHDSRGGTTTNAAQRLRHAFIVGQIALAFVLLSGASLLAVSLKRALEVAPGFRPDQVLSGRITLPWNIYQNETARLIFAERLEEELRRLPGVTAIGLINNIPLSGDNGRSAIAIKGYVPEPGESIRGHYAYGVTGDYFTVMGIPLLEGRFLAPDESRRNARSCVIDEDFARRYWPQGGAIGHRLFLGGLENESEAYTVVGVVGAVRQRDLTEDEAQGAIYYPYGYHTHNDAFVVVRTSQAAESLNTALQKIVRKIDPDLPVTDIESMEARISESLVNRRSPTLLAGIFAASALLLAGIGTYGVLAYAVTQRRREIGLRMALGAMPARIGRQFLALGLRLLALGTLLGIIGAWLVGRAMQGILFNVPSLHVATLAATVLIIGLVALAACLLPVLRASRVDPMEALRSE